MKRSKRYYDEWADQLAAPDQTPPEGDAVATFVGLLRSVAADDVAQETAAAIVAAEALGVAEGGAVRGTRSQKTVPLTIRWRRRIMISTFLSSLFGKIAVGAVAVAIAATATATGNLPDPAQQRVSDALSRVGIEVPAPDQASEAADDTAADHQPNASGEPTAPVLPAQASDTAKAVTATVFGSTLTGRAFGEAVSAAAKGSASRDATRAVPAIPAVPAVPGKPTVPAIPATPAVPPSSR